MERGEKYRKRTIMKDMQDDQARKKARIEQVKMDREMAEAEMRAMQKDFNRRIHDQAFAYELNRIPDNEWAKTGNSFHRPYGEGTSSAAGAYKLYCKGLVREEMVGGVKKMLAGIGIAICDSRDELVFEIKKPSVPSAFSSDFADLKALMEGINVVLMLGIKHLNVLCDNRLVHQYVTGVYKTRHENMTTLVAQISHLRKKFFSCSVSLVLQKDIKFAFGLANEAIVSQLTWRTRTCKICLESDDARKMFSIDGCQHRYCSSCIKQHAKAKLLEGKLPKCPHEGCTVEMKLESCKNMFKPEVFNMMSQRVKEASIPAIKKVYCPKPKCSFLMSKTEALANTDNAGASKCLKCRGLFCVKCKVPWHKNMNCEAYKKLNPFPCAEDAKLNSLAMTKQWRQCLMCKNMVELAEGCYHIHCRCGYEFCYTCGAAWKQKKATCKCRLWDERNIIRRR